MESMSMHNEQTKSKRKNLALTTTIASVFFMPNLSFSQKKSTTKDAPNINYLAPQTNPYLLYNLKDINTEYPNRESFLKSLMDGLKPQVPHEIKQNINTEPPVVPLSFAKNGVHKYFPERSTCFKEIISKIQQNHQSTHQINMIINETIMRPTKVHKETNPRYSSERDKVCAILMFLDGILGQNTFAHYIDQLDHLDELGGTNKVVTDTMSYYFDKFDIEEDRMDYDTRLKIADGWIMPGEMIDRVLEADRRFRNLTEQQKSDQEIAIR